MIYKNVELHNVEEVKNTNDGGIELYRFPFEYIDSLKITQSTVVSRSNAGCEIRFVSDAKVIWVTMGARLNDLKLTVFCGDLFNKEITIEAGKKVTFELLYNDSFDKVDETVLKGTNDRFSNNVWRIYINGDDNSYCTFYDIQGLDGIIRPPKDDEKPSIKWLAYGSGVTYGKGAKNTLNSYIQQTANRLGVDVLNKGMVNSCFCEKEMIGYINNAKWDILSLEIGADMYWHKTKEFKKRVEYTIKEIYKLNSDKKIFVITPFPNIYGLGKDKDLFDKNIEYTKILRDIVEEISSDNVRLIFGDNILNNKSYLSCDLINPSEYGHIRMGENLANLLKERI